MTNFEFMEKAEEKMERCWSFLMNKYNVNHRCPSLAFTLKGRVAGMATGGREINLNMGFVAKNAEDMLEQTVPHEVVHCWLTATRHPSHVKQPQVSFFCHTRRSPHGPEFMRVLGELGCRQERTHNYDCADVQTKSQRMWDYKCPLCNKVLPLTTTIHNKIQRGQKRFHSRCNHQYNPANVLTRVY